MGGHLNKIGLTDAIMFNNNMWNSFVHAGVVNDKPLQKNNTIMPTITLLNVLIQTINVKDRSNVDNVKDRSNVDNVKVPIKLHDIEILSAIEKDKYDNLGEPNKKSFENTLKNDNYPQLNKEINKDATYIPLGRAYFIEHWSRINKEDKKKTLPKKLRRCFFLERIDRGVSHPGFLIQAVLALKSYIEKNDQRSEVPKLNKDDPGFDIGCHNTTNASNAYIQSGWEIVDDNQLDKKLFDMTHKLNWEKFSNIISTIESTPNHRTLNFWKEIPCKAFEKYKHGDSYESYKEELNDMNDNQYKEFSIMP